MQENIFGPLKMTSTTTTALDNPERVATPMTVVISFELTQVICVFFVIQLFFARAI